MNSEDFYSVLGVSQMASPAQIKERFRFLSHAYHPDKFATDAQRRIAEVEFKRINEAYQILSDPSQRARFDASRSAPPPSTTQYTSPPASSPSPPTGKPPANKSAYSWVSTVLIALVLFSIRHCNEQRPEDRRTVPPPAPPAASQEVRRSSVRDGSYHNEFFAFSLLIPSNWEVMPAQELNEMQNAGREFIALQSTELQQRLHSGEGRYLVLFTARPQSDTGWSVLPTFSANAESILANRTAEGYLRLMERTLEQLQGVSLIPSRPYRLQCRGRNLTGIDYANRADANVHVAILITIERGYALSFVLSAGDQETLERLKELAGTINFR